MGYYTYYELLVDDHSDPNVEYEDELNKHVPGYDEVVGYEIKWYSHEADMKSFSKKHPLVLFTLEGTGEEKGDFWRKYFLNGKMQHANAKLVFPEFDPDKLR